MAITATVAPKPMAPTPKAAHAKIAPEPKLEAARPHGGALPVFVRSVLGAKSGTEGETYKSTSKVATPLKPSTPTTVAASSMSTGSSLHVSETKAQPKLAPLAPATTPSAGGGQALAPHIKEAIQNSLLVDLSNVRLHASSADQRKAQSLSARAFTFGNDIFLGHGEHPTDLTLISHEAVHVIQQQSAPAMQAWSNDRSDRYEREADRAAAAVVRGEPFTVCERVTSPRVQRLGISDALDWLADKAYVIPGFRMFTIVLGVNPVNMEPVERSAANVLRAVVEFLPGGTLITKALDKYGVFDKVGNWVSGQIDKLGMVGSSIKNALMDFLDSLSWRDIFHLGDVWDRAKRIFTDPIDRIIDFVKGLLEGIWAMVREVILKPISKLAEGTAGWDLLVAVMGENPITGETVKPTPDMLIGGFMKLIHEEEVWENIKKAHAIERAFNWFKSVLSGLWEFVSQIPGLFIKALKSLEWSDILDLPAGFMKIVGVFGKFLGNFVTWAFDKVLNLLQIIVEAVAPSVMPYLRKVEAAFKEIIRHPIIFVRHLIAAGKLGLHNFMEHFGTHLKTALLDWLTGSMPGVYIPKAFTLSEFGMFALSVLGLTWSQIRAKIVKSLGPNGETIMTNLETTFDIIVALVTGGPAAAWELMKEKLTNLKDLIIDGIVGFVVDTVIKKAIPKLISMFIPGAGFISAIISIYGAIMVFVEKLSKIVAAVKAFVDSIVNIANGQIEGAAEKVESGMAGMLSVAISFFAGFVGLGNMASKLLGVFEKVRAPVEKARDGAIDWVVDKAKKFWSTAKGAAQKVAGGLAGLLGIRKEVRLTSGETHTLSFVEGGPRMVLMAASTPTEFRRFITGIGAPNFMREEKNMALMMVDRIDALEDDTRATNTDHNEQIVNMLDALGRITTEIMNAAFKRDIRTTPPVYAGLRDGFARGMRVMLATDELSGGTSPSVNSPLWDQLNMRRSGDGSYYVKGHLLNEGLGGPGSVWENLTPLSRSGNTQHERRAESIIKPTGGDPPRFFLYVVTPSYGRSVNTGLIAQINSPTNSDPLAVKARKEQVVQAERSVPTNLLCSITELDALGRHKEGAVDHTYEIENDIEQESPADYKV